MAITTDDAVPSHRRRKTALQRREQRLRAEARTALRLIKGVDSLASHRGSTLCRVGMDLRESLRRRNMPKPNAADGPPPKLAEIVAAYPLPHHSDHDEHAVLDEAVGVEQPLKRPRVDHAPEDAVAEPERDEEPQLREDPEPRQQSVAPIADSAWRGIDVTALSADDIDNLEFFRRADLQSSSEVLREEIAEAIQLAKDPKNREHAALWKARARLAANILRRQL